MFEGAAMTTGSDSNHSAHQLIDLSHSIEHGMITYRGLPGPVISDYMSREQSRSQYAAGTEFYIGTIEMVANTGTYLDSPFHRYANGHDLSEIPLSSIADLPGIVIRTLEPRTTSAAFQGLNLAGKAVLVHTGWDAHWRTEQYSSGHPFLTEDAAQFLADSKAALVGIDSYNIDSVDDGRRPAHSTLLAADIPIVEHLCGLGQLPDSGFRFFAVPAKVGRLGSFPVRAFAMITELTVR
jgi:arylformamidase